MPGYYDEWGRPLEVPPYVVAERRWHPFRALVEGILALVALGIVLLILANRGVGPFAAAPPGTCTVRLGSHDAAVTMSGNDASLACQDIINAYPSFAYGTVVSGANQLCSTTISAVNGTLTMAVYDTGDDDYGDQICNGIGRYEQAVGSA